VLSPTFITDRSQLMGIEVVLIIMGLTWSWKIGFLMAGVSVFLGELFTF
jgi:hypothetical protein